MKVTSLSERWTPLKIESHSTSSETTQLESLTFELIGLRHLGGDRVRLPNSEVNYI
jgi:hypothetical protein